MYEHLLKGSTPLPAYEVVGESFHPDCTCANVRRVHETYCPKYVPAWRRRLMDKGNGKLVAVKVYQAR